MGLLLSGLAALMAGPDTPTNIMAVAIQVRTR
jgi:hypothetical protein